MIIKVDNPLTHMLFMEEVQTTLNYYSDKDIPINELTLEYSILLGKFNSVSICHKDKQGNDTLLTTIKL